MQYHSTRGAAPVLGFDEVLLSGLARDGGLYVPTAWPGIAASELRRLQGAPYLEVARRVLTPFLGGSVALPVLDRLLAAAYGSFEHRAVTPLVQLGPNLWLLELFHGPTLAFKDVALQLLGQLFERVLGERGQRVTIVGATSGDTGSAAIEAVRDRAAVDIFMLHPRGRTSEVQRRQMTTVLSPNVTNIAVEGSFDDCQDLVKALFNDLAFRDELRLSAVNSINWARILAQAVYYVAAGLALGAPDREIAYVVPTGNFGNVYAGYVARRIGLPVGKLVVAANRNDILQRFFASGTMSMEGVAPSLSPSMDIQVSSNFERLLFDLLDRDGAAVAKTMRDFRASGRFTLDPARHARALALFDAGRLDDAGTLEEMRRVRRETGLTIDPHTAVGVAVARDKAARLGLPTVVLATAHPAKFPDAVEQATGQRPALPDRLADLYRRPERMEGLANEAEALKRLIRARIAGRNA
jgi:threonine synthase